MKLPLVGTPEMAGPQRTFTPLNPTTFDKVGQAGARLGQAVQGIGAEAGSLGEQIKGAIDQGTLQELDAKKHVALASAIDEFSDGKNPENGNPHSFMPRWESKQKEFTESLQNDPAIQALSPVARAQFKASMGAWTRLSTQSVGHFATDKALDITQAQYLDAFHAKMLGGQMDEAVAGLKDGLQRGAVKPEIGLPLIQHAPVEHEYNQANQLLSVPISKGGGPLVLEDKLRETDANGKYTYAPHLVGDMRTQLLLHAHREGAIMQSDNLNDWRMKVDANPNDPATTDGIQKAAVTREITQAGANNLLAGIARTNLREAKATADVVAMRVHDHDFLADKDPEGTARAMKDEIAGLPAPVRKPVWEQIDNRLAAAKKAEAVQEKPAQKDIFDRMKEDRNENGTFVPQVNGTVPGKTHWFGKNDADTVELRHVTGGLKALQNEDKFSDADIEKTFGKGVTRKMVLDAEEMHYAEQTGKMRDWFKAHADEEGKPGFEEKAEKARQDFTRPYIVKLVKDSLMPEAAKPTLSAQDREAVDWANAHPEDSRSKAILKRTGQ